MTTDTTKLKAVKRNIPILKFGVDHDVPTIEGKFLGLRTEEVTDKMDGEVKERTRAIFQDLKGVEKFQVWTNAGLKNALSMSDVKEGELIRITHLGLKELGGGRTVNQYDVYSLN